MSKIMTFFIIIIAVWYIAPRVASAQWFGGNTPLYQNTGYYGTSSYNYGNNPSGWGYEPAYQGNFNNNNYGVFNQNCNCYRQPLIQVNLPSLFGNNRYQNMPYYQQPMGYYGNNGYYPNQYGGYMQTTGSQFGYGTPTVW